MCGCAGAGCSSCTPGAPVFGTQEWLTYAKQKSSAGNIPPVTPTAYKTFAEKYLNTTLSFWQQKMLDTYASDHFSVKKEYHVAPKKNEAPEPAPTEEEEVTLKNLTKHQRAQITAYAVVHKISRLDAFEKLGLGSEYTCPWQSKKLIPNAFADGVTGWSEFGDKSPCFCIPCQGYFKSKDKSVVTLSLDTGTIHASNIYFAKLDDQEAVVTAKTKMPKLLEIELWAYAYAHKLNMHDALHTLGLNKTYSNTYNNLAGHVLSPQNGPNEILIDFWPDLPKCPQDLEGKCPACQKSVSAETLDEYAAAKVKWPLPEDDTPESAVSEPTKPHWPKYPNLLQSPSPDLETIKKWQEKFSCTCGPGNSPHASNCPANPVNLDSKDGIAWFNSKMNKSVASALRRFAYLHNMSRYSAYNALGLDYGPNPYNPLAPKVLEQGILSSDETKNFLHKFYLFCKCDEVCNPALMAEESVGGVPHFLKAQLRAFAANHEMNRFQAYNFLQLSKKYGPNPYDPISPIPSYAKVDKKWPQIVDLSICACPACQQQKTAEPAKVPSPAHAAALVNKWKAQAPELPAAAFIESLSYKQKQMISGEVPDVPDNICECADCESAKKAYDAWLEKASTVLLEAQSYMTAVVPPAVPPDVAWELKAPWSKPAYTDDMSALKDSLLKSFKAMNKPATEFVAILTADEIYALGGEKPPKCGDPNCKTCVMLLAKQKANAVSMLQSLNVETFPPGVTEPEGTRFEKVKKGDQIVLVAECENVLSVPPGFKMLVVSRG